MPFQRHVTAAVPKCSRCCVGVPGKLLGLMDVGAWALSCGQVIDMHEGYAAVLVKVPRLEMYSCYWHRVRTMKLVSTTTVVQIHTTTKFFLA